MQIYGTVAGNAITCNIVGSRRKPLKACTRWRLVFLMIETFGFRKSRPFPLDLLLAVAAFAASVSGPCA